MKRRLDYRLIVMKLRLSAKNLRWLLGEWHYSVLALAVAAVFYELVYWLFNLSTLATLLGSPSVSLVGKLRVLSSAFSATATVNGWWSLLLMVLVSVLQGVSIAALIYSIRRQRHLDATALGGESLVGLLAVIGLGCPSCGTSVLTPLIAVFASSSAVAVSETLTKISLPLALAVGLFGLYKLGLNVASVKARVDQRTLAS